MNVFFGSGIANGGGQLLGGSAPATPLATFLAALRSAGAVVTADYNIDNNLVATSSGMTSWDDNSGGGGPTILPLGAAGGGTTGPKLIGTGASAILKANGNVGAGGSTTQWAATASAIIDKSKAFSLLLVAEIPTGNGAFAFGLIQAISAPSSYQMFNILSAGTKVTMIPSTMQSPGVLPAAGVRIAILVTYSGLTPWSTSIQTLEQFGRGGNWVLSTVPAAVNMFLQFGGYTGQTSNNVVGARHILAIDRPFTQDMRDALHTYLTDATAGHLPTTTPTTHYLQCVGDSLVYGQQAVPGVSDQNRVPAGPVGAGPVGPWPNVLQAWYTAAGKPVDVGNFGYPLRTTADFLATSATMPVCLFDQFLASHTQERVTAGFKNILGMFMGTNDFPGGGSTAAQIYARITQLIGKAQAKGYSKVIIGTILPRGEVGYEPTRLALNTLIRGNTAGADVIVDFTTGAGATVFYDPSTFAGSGGSDTAGNPTTSSTYYYTDQVHLLNAGYGVVAQCVKDALDATGWIP